MGIGDICLELEHNLESMRAKFDAMGPDFDRDPSYEDLSLDLQDKLEEALDDVRTFDSDAEEPRIFTLRSAIRFAGRMREHGFADKVIEDMLLFDGFMEKEAHGLATGCGYCIFNVGHGSGRPLG